MPYTPELERLAELQQICDHTTHLIEMSVRRAREQGATWEQIGAPLGLTRQGAQQKFGKAS